MKRQTLHTPDGRNQRRGRALLAGLTLASGLALAVGLRFGLGGATAYQPAYRLTDAVQEEVNTSAFAMILGEARASMADMMWIKTERYLHRGVAYRPHLDADAMARTGEVARQKAPAQPHQGAPAEPAVEKIGGTTLGEHDDHDDEGGGPQGLIPEARKDYRGFVGVIQRAVQPWKEPGDPDEHTEGGELVPWYRMLTYSDPHHWRGYMIGTWWLSKQPDLQALAEAEKFLREGIRNNPEAFQLQLMLGRLEAQKQNYREAIPAFERAARLALKIRPAGGKEKMPVWSDSDEEDFLSALHYIPYLQWRKLGDRRGAAASLAWAKTILPSDRRLNSMENELKGAEQPATPLTR